MIRLAGLCLLFSPLPLAAEDLPALFSVTGVASDDVLNIRAAPDPSSDILGALTPDATGIEVISESDGWASINVEDRSGRVAARYLRPMGHAPWYQLQIPLHCAGTEPFWSLDIDPQAATASFLTPELSEPQVLALDGFWPGEDWLPSAAVSFDHGLAVVRP